MRFCACSTDGKLALGMVWKADGCACRLSDGGAIAAAATAPVPPAVDWASNNAYGRAEGNQMLSKQNPFDIHLIEKDINRSNTFQIDWVVVCTLGFHSHLFKIHWSFFYVRLNPFTRLKTPKLPMPGFFFGAHSTIGKIMKHRFSPTARLLWIQFW